MLSIMFHLQRNKITNRTFEVFNFSTESISGYSQSDTSLLYEDVLLRIFFKFFFKLFKIIMKCL